MSKTGFKMARFSQIFKVLTLMDVHTSAQYANLSMSHDRTARQNANCPLSTNFSFNRYHVAQHTVSDQEEKPHKPHAWEQMCHAESRISSASAFSYGPVILSTAAARCTPCYRRDTSRGAALLEEEAVLCVYGTAPDERI
ncbi:unnamed protein product [Leuciscus chuanchicus]